jgi:hypothetical protein
LWNNDWNLKKGTLLCGQTLSEVEDKVEAKFPNAQITSLSWNLLTLLVRKVDSWNLLTSLRQAQGK